MPKVLLLVAVGFLVNGCAYGVKHSYDGADAKFNIQSKATVAVAVHDRRPYVVSGDKEANFVGLTRGLYWVIPFDVTTKSGKPLADEFASSIASALTADGIVASTNSVAPETSGQAARRALRRAHADRFVLVTLREWKADTSMDTALVYDVLLRVFDRKGVERARKVLQGRDDLGGSFFSPPSHSRKAVPEAFRRKLEEMFDDPQIVAALG